MKDFRFAVLILVKYLSVNCDEDAARNTAVNKEELAKVEIFTEDYMLQEKIPVYIEYSDVSLHELRTATDFALEAVTEYYEFSDSISAAVSVTEKIAESHETIVPEEEEYDKLELFSKLNVSQDENNKTNEIPKIVPKIEGNKTEEHLEASAERKFDIDNETFPSILDEPDGNPNSDTIDRLNLEESKIRRMFLNPNIAVDADTKLEDTFANENLGVKISPNTDFDQFASNNDRKLINLILDHKGINDNIFTFTPATVAMKTTRIITPLTNNELLNPFLIRNYLTPGLNLFSSLLNAQLQGQHVPIYMEIQFDEILSGIHMVGIQNPYSSEEQRRNVFDQENQQYETAEPSKSLDRKEPENLSSEYIMYNFKDQMKRTIEPTITFDYIPSQNLRQKPRIQELQNDFIMDHTKYPNNNRFQNLRFGELVQSPMNTRLDDINQEKFNFQSFNVNQDVTSKNFKNFEGETRNEAPFFQGRIDSEKSHERVANPYSFKQSNAPELGIEANKNYDSNSQKLKTLLQKLVQASEQPKHLTTSN